MITYFPLTVILIIIVGSFSYTISEDIIKKQSVKIVTQVQQQNKITIDTNCKNIENFLNNIAYKKDTQDFMKGNYEIGIINTEKITNYEENLITWMSLSEIPSNLAIVRNGDNLNEIIPNNFHNILNDNNYNGMLKPHINSYQIYNCSRIKQIGWYRNINGYSKNPIWLKISNDKFYGNISIIKNIPDYNNFNTSIGTMILTIPIKSIFITTQAANIGSNFFNMCFDDQGKIIYIDKSKKEFYEKYKAKIDKYIQGNVKDMYLIDKNTAVLTIGVNKNKWKFISIISMSEITNKTKRIKNLVVICCVLALIFLFIATFLLSRLFSNKIIKILKYMKKFQEGNFKEKLENIDNDELGFIAKSYNEMVERTEYLINEAYESNLKKKEAELRTLQAQISPHFLANSLSSVNRLVTKGDLGNITTMVNSLVIFYRMTLNKGKDIITISNEIEQAKAYIRILKIRMSEIFNIFYDIDEDVKRFFTVKVILQPFIENIIDHAVFDREGPINIIISIKMQDNSIIFKIIDDGVGMSENKIKSLFLNDSSVSSGYGIINVDEKLKMYYGNEYGIKIFSKLGIGTVITIKIPKSE
ncbi:sensor histidine kinase [uncultured Clostridium sp.]|uniref:sensor histidine kinase n=1 Tax=uncultured Clostridium sp. TaxID=59620 RepID=UPI00262EE74D|nr:histidine kinase [uncultured Clostridium sp.]